MSDLYEGTYNVNDGLELIIPTTFEEALTYAQQILWLYYNKQSKLVEGENITLTENSDGTTTISCTIPPGHDGVGIKSIVGTVGDTGTTVVVTLTDDTTQSFFVERGPQGIQGETGPQGPAGPQGEQGPAGADGRDGVDGQDGQDGQAATIAVGSVTTGQPGTPASVVNSGTSSAAVLDFTIPAGADGQPGQTGPAGPGVASGGTQGQVLKKKTTGTDYDTEWGNISEVPSGGSNGDVLTQSANGPIWQAPSGGGGGFSPYSTRIWSWSSPTSINLNSPSNNINLAFNTTFGTALSTALHRQIVSGEVFDIFTRICIAGIKITYDGNDYYLNSLKNTSTSSSSKLQLCTDCYFKYQYNFQVWLDNSKIIVNHALTSDPVGDTDSLVLDVNSSQHTTTSPYPIYVPSSIPVMGWFHDGTKVHTVIGYITPTFGIEQGYVRLYLDTSAMNSLSYDLTSADITLEVQPFVFTSTQ